MGADSGEIETVRGIANSHVSSPSSGNHIIVSLRNKVMPVAHSISTLPFLCGDRSQRDEPQLNKN
jgi:hypothetical protein